MPDIAVYMLRNLAGFLLQLVPCASLCFVPFTTRLRWSQRRTYGTIAVTLAVALIPFCLVGSLPLPDSVLPLRFTFQNILFLIVLAILLAIYVRAIDAHAEQKVFAFIVVLCYGYVVTQTVDIAFGSLLNFASDDYMYPPSLLLANLIIQIVFFMPMTALMRKIQTMLDSPLDKRVWIQMTLLPCLLVATMFFAGYLPASSGAPYSTVFHVMELTLSVLTIALMWWMLRTINMTAHAASHAASLADALRRRSAERRELMERLRSERARANKLEDAVNMLTEQLDEQSSQAASPDDPIVLATPTQAISFQAGSLVYVESLNRAHILHLDDGSSMQTSISLAQIVEQLPGDRFMYCHRSIVVNLDQIASLSGEQITLRGGATVPVSRRRIAELRGALAARGEGR